MQVQYWTSVILTIKCLPP